MRKKYIAVFVCTVAILSAASVSVTGQQEPLPVVTPKQPADAVAPDAAPAVYLASEPIREFLQPSLEDAARNNDYVTFDALYRAAKERGEDVSRFATLHELWTWAISDPVGAFYGREMYTKLARVYPGYAEFIADFAITDSNGNTFWPTSETRVFLIARAGAGEAARTQLVENGTKAGTKAEPKAKPEGRGEGRAANPRGLETRRDIGAHARAEARATLVPRATAAAAPVVTARVAAAAPVAAATPVAAANEAPAVVIRATEEVAAPQAAAVNTAPATTTTPAVTRRDNSLANRGLLLLVLGLIGVGLLAVIFRTPKEEDEPHVPASNVEPIRKPAVPASETPRATGSHG